MATSIEGNDVVTVLAFIPVNGGGQQWVMPAG